MADNGPPPTEPVPGQSLAQGAVPLALRDLSRRWRDLEAPEMGIWIPQALSSEELNNRKAILLEITTELLPSMQAQLPVLLKSLGLGPYAVDSRPKLGVTNDTIGKIATTLDLIHRSILSLSQDNNETDSPPPRGVVKTYGVPPRGVDKTYGILKKFRCGQLFITFQDFASQLYHVFRACAQYVKYYESGKLDRDREIRIASRSRLIESPPPAPRPHPAINKIAEGVSRCHEWLDVMMGFSTRSDLWLFQVSKWGTVISRLSEYLTVLTERLDTISKIQTFELFDEGRSDRLHQLLYPPIIPILKVLRIFFNQLMDRTNKTKLNLGDFLSTENLLSLDSSGEAIMECLQKIISDSLVFDGDLLDQADTLEQRARKLAALLDHFIVTLAFHHVPQASRSNLPPSESIFKPMFYVIQAQFRMAVGRFKDACQELRDRSDEIQAVPRA